MPLIEGKTPWEFACAWYTPESIAHSLDRCKANGGRFIATGAEMPTDVFSQEFADWLTDQYRLAMTKGIELGQQSVR